MEIKATKKCDGIITSLHRGGAERQMLYLFKNNIISRLFLIQNKIEYSIPENRAGDIYLLDSNIKKNKPLLQYFLIPFYSFRISKMFDSNHVIISFVERSDILNVFSKIFFKHKSIVNILTNPIEAYKGLRYFLYLALKIVYTFSDVIVSNSKGAAEFLRRRKYLKNKVFTIYNPISIDNIKEKSLEKIKEEDFFKKYPVFVNVGRLTYAKGQWNLLRVFKDVKNKLPNAKLLIIGDGELRKYLVDLSNNLGLKTFTNFGENKEIEDGFDVYFLGSQDNPFKYVKNSSIFVFTSLLEGFPNAILEALACDIPIISSDCRFGPREILAPETDFMIETQNPEYGTFGVLMPVLDKKKKSHKEPISDKERIWSNEIINFYKNKELREYFSKKSTDRIKDFEEKIIISEWENLLNNEILKCQK